MENKIEHEELVRTVEMALAGACWRMEVAIGIGKYKCQCPSMEEMRKKSREELLQMLRGLSPSTYNQISG